ncbi:MAG: hypothetical protein WC501_00720 [Candidatus Micrarchaeia archaeon]|jgi:hypothetical protein
MFHLSEQMSSGARNTTNHSKFGPSMLLENLSLARTHGKDEFGKKTECSFPNLLGLSITVSTVSFFTYRSNKNFLKSLSTKDADGLVKEGTHKRKDLLVITDLYRAVRLFSYQKEKYRIEFRESKLAKLIEELNLDVYSSDNFSEKLENIFQKLTELKKELEAKQGAPFYLPTEHLKKAEKLLMKARDEKNKSRRTTMIGSVHMLISSKNRTREGRIDEILRRGSMASLRENAVRRKRDEFIMERLEYLINLTGKGNEKCFAIKRLWENDQKTTDILEKLTQKNVKRKMELLQNEKLDEKKNGFVEAARKFLLENEETEAFYELKKLYFFILSNKPKYILEQLEKTQDGYLHEKNTEGYSFMDYFKSGVELFENGVFERAGHCFKKAGEILSQSV